MAKEVNYKSVVMTRAWVIFKKEGGEFKVALKKAHAEVAATAKAIAVAEGQQKPAFEKAARVSAIKIAHTRKNIKKAFIATEWAMSFFDINITVKEVVSATKAGDNAFEAAAELAKAQLISVPDNYGTEIEKGYFLGNLFNYKGKVYQEVYLKGIGQSIPWLYTVDSIESDGRLIEASEDVRVHHAKVTTDITKDVRKITSLLNKINKAVKEVVENPTPRRLNNLAKAKLFSGTLQVPKKVVKLIDEINEIIMRNRYTYGFEAHKAIPSTVVVKDDGTVYEYRNRISY